MQAKLDQRDEDKNRVVNKLERVIHRESAQMQAKIQNLEQGYLQQKQDIELLTNQLNDTIDQLNRQNKIIVRLNMILRLRGQLIQSIQQNDEQKIGEGGDVTSGTNDPKKPTIIERQQVIIEMLEQNILRNQRIRKRQCERIKLLEMYNNELSKKSTSNAVVNRSIMFVNDRRKKRFVQTLLKK